jgi:hypothetical protein
MHYQPSILVCGTTFLCSLFSVSLSQAAPHIPPYTPADTISYYNERGELLWQNAQAMRTASYVIKTSKKPGEIFSEVHTDDSAIQTSAEYHPASVTHIARRTRNRVEKLILRGAANDPLVISNIVLIHDINILRQMYRNIQSRCSTRDDRRFKEHGGVLLPDGTITCITGDVSDPHLFTGATLSVKANAVAYYHSHPTGSVEKRRVPAYESADDLNPNRISFAKSTVTEWISYIQGPSKQDQLSVGNKIGYVFSLTGGDALIYVYDSSGVIATLPVSFVKHQRTKLRHSRKPQAPGVETFIADAGRRMY